MIVIQCAGCGRLVNAKTKRRVYCTDDCRTKAKKDASERQMSRTDRLDEFLWIAGTDSWHNIATRLGFKSVERLREWVRAQGEIGWAERITRDGLVDRLNKWAA